MPEIHREGLYTENDWERCLQDKEFFLRQAEYTKVPVELRWRVYDASANLPGRLQVKRDIYATFSTALTYEEFCTVLRVSKNNTSVGMTGCFYNKLKHWPTDLLRSTYDGLVSCLESKQYFLEWKWRWLKALAKKSTAEIRVVGDLRPIILVEVLRKIWSKCVLPKLQVVWRKHDILNVSQHGYSAHRGTYTAMLQNHNLLEDAIEYGLPLHSKTWGMN